MTVPGIISRYLTGRAIDELSVRLAGATEFAIEEIVRLRGGCHQGRRRGRAAAAPRRDSERRRAHHRLPAQQAVRHRRRRLGPAGRFPGRRHRHGDRCGPGRRRPCSSTRRSRSSWPSRRPMATISTRTTTARPTCASCMALDAGVATLGKHGVELADGTRLDPRDRVLSENLNRGLGELVVQRTVRVRARTLLGARSRSASASQSVRARTSGRCAARAARHCAISTSPRTAPRGSNPRRTVTPAARASGLVSGREIRHRARRNRPARRARRRKPDAGAPTASRRGARRARDVRDRRRHGRRASRLRRARCTSD